MTESKSRMRRRAIQHPFAGFVGVGSEVTLRIWWRLPLWCSEQSCVTCAPLLAGLSHGDAKWPEGMGDSNTFWSLYREAIHYRKSNRWFANFAWRMTDNERAAR